MAGTGIRRGIATSGGRSFGRRLLGALRLDAAVYEEVEHDPGAIPQAAAVIGLAAVAQALGSWSTLGPPGLVAFLVAGFLGWLVSTAIVWAIGAKAFGHTTDFPELLRTLGFASAPYLGAALGILPLGPLRAVLWLVVAVLVLVAFVIAVRQALDVGTGRAVLVCVLAVAANVLLAALLGGLLPAPAPPA